MQFLLSEADGLEMKFAIMKCYDQAALSNLVYVQAWAMLKELKWLQFLFLAGNYPLVKSRLRFVWEAMYRAYYVEGQQDPEIRALGPDDKLALLECHRPRLDWTNCVGPVLRSILPGANSEEVFKQYH